MMSWESLASSSASLAMPSQAVRSVSTAPPAVSSQPPPARLDSQCPACLHCKYAHSASGSTPSCLDPHPRRLIRSVDWPLRSRGSLPIMVAPIQHVSKQ
jgi:hypothetical protein